MLTLGKYMYALQSTNINPNGPGKNLMRPVKVSAQSIKQASSQSVSQPTNQPTNQPQATNQPTNRFVFIINRTNVYNIATSNVLTIFFFHSSLPSAVLTMRLSQDSSRLPFCLLFGRFTSPGSFWIFFSFRSSLT